MNNKLINFIKEASHIRKVGQTTWLLEAALINPKCILVFENEAAKSSAARQYYSMRLKSWKKLPFYKKLILDKDTYLQQRMPYFVTINNSLQGYKLPILFDSSCFPLIFQTTINGNM